MKKILLTSALFLLNLGASFAQIEPISKWISIKKGEEDAVSQQVYDYLTNTMGLTYDESNDIYSGVMKDMDFTRVGNKKCVSSFDYKVRAVATQGKLTLTYLLCGINSQLTICDRSQKEEEGSLPVESIPGFMITKFTKAVDNVTNCLSGFIRNGVRKKPECSKEPYWTSLTYIVEPSAVSYFTVLTSKKGLKKELIYKIFENYFTYAYRSGKAVIENKSVEDYTIVAKGVFSNIHKYVGGCTETYDVPHVVTIQCRDGRMRVTITVSDYDIYRQGNAYVSSKRFTRNIAAYEPFGEMKDKEMVECLEKVELNIVSTFMDMQNALDEGNNALENIDDW